MGNHGPAYYKRYPKEFEKFTPVCKTNQLEECTQEEVSNAYDNAILYTDYFLSKVINFLKPYSNDYETAMLYMSDHGESLGENGFYLHGMPYMLAPDEQKHIASVLWLGGEMREDYDIEKLNSYKNESFSQDNLFHTLLGLFEVGTDVYKKDMDILNDSRKPE
jgi:lipid A ethanolaminephosphotransferase